MRRRNLLDGAAGRSTGPFSARAATRPSENSISSGMPTLIAAALCNGRLLASRTKANPRASTPRYENAARSSPPRPARDARTAMQCRTARLGAFAKSKYSFALLADARAMDGKIGGNAGAQS